MASPTFPVAKIEAELAQLRRAHMLAIAQGGHAEAHGLRQDILVAEHQLYDCGGSCVKLREGGIGLEAAFGDAGRG